MKSGLAFVVSHIDVDGELPIELIPGHVFRKARDNEVDEINRLIREFTLNSTWVRYDSVVREERYNERTTYHFEKLAKDKWKYWVVAFEGFNTQIYKLERVAILLEHDLDFGFQIFYSEPKQGGQAVGFLGMPLYYIEKYSLSDEIYKNAKELTSSQISSIGALYTMYHQVPEKFEFVKHAVDNFSSLGRIPKRSELMTVGYFSIIETLITHPPRLTETLDSISHQITNKMMLLSKRFSRQISPSNYFLHTVEERIWKKLYGYRSCLAHGNAADFHTEFQILKNQDSVLQFLKENIKELLILAMKEPEFLCDLKKC